MRLLLIGAGLALLALVIPARQAAAADTTPLKPGDKIGQMEVTTGRSGVRGLSVYCPDAGDCTIPQVDKVAIGNAWDANSQQTLDANWADITWELSLDGRKIDLAAFGTIDSDRLRPELGSGVVTKSRAWDVVLVNPTPGPHPIHVALHVQHNLSDGFSMYPSATYEFDFDFTVEGAQPATIPRTGDPDAAWPLPFGAAALILVALGLLLRQRAMLQVR